MFFLLVKRLALRAGQRQGGVFRLPPPYLWTPLSPQRVKGCSPLTIPMRKSKPKNASRFAKRIFCASTTPSGSERGEQPLSRGSSASKSLVLFWFSFGTQKRTLALMQKRSKPAPPARNIVSLFRTLRFASGFTLSHYLPPAQYSTAPHPRATHPGYVPPAPDSSGGCGPASHGLPASGR